MAKTSGDMVDAASIRFKTRLSSELAEVESRELGRIEYALERMREGHLGFVRAATPASRWPDSIGCLATYCIECQREAEAQRPRRRPTSTGAACWIRPVATSMCRSTTLRWMSRDDGGLAASG